MKNSQNITIVLLAITAVILGAILIGSYATPANAGDMAKGGDYILTTMQYSGSKDLICVIDMSTRKMATYNLTVSTETVDQVDMTDLDKVFGE